MKFTEVVFFINTPLSQRDFERFGVRILEKAGFKVSFFDFTSFLFPDFSKRSKITDSLLDNRVIEIHSRKEILDLLSTKKNTIAINFLDFNPSTAFVFRGMKKVGLPYARIYVNAVPNVARAHRWKNRFINGQVFDLGFIWNRLRYLLVLWLERKTVLFSSPFFVFKGGKKAGLRAPMPDRKTFIINVHAWDYDLYLKAEKSTREQRRAAVFMDVFFPFHPDYFLNVRDNPGINPRKYYKDLNHLFSLFEKTFNMPVEIALHPRSRYKGNTKLFFGRPLHRGNTIELVASAQVVFGHFSTSVNFPILFNKPLILLTSTDINKSWFGPQTINMANSLGKVPVFSDRATVEDLRREIEINRPAYKEYINNYIKAPGSPNRPFWEIVAEEFNSCDYNGGDQS